MRLVPLAHLCLGAAILWLCQTAATCAPEPVPFADLQMGGELAQRLNRNFDRLETPLYQPPLAFGNTQADANWPGDKIGRTLLGLILDAQATHRKPKYLGTLLSQIPEKTNREGYFGPIYPKGTVNEQQLASHGWVLRALCEHYLWKRDKPSLRELNRILDNLVIPSQGMQERYPINPAQRGHGGGYSGTTSAKIGGWMISSDTGCDLIFMDGLAQAYEVTGRKELLPILNEMAELFEKLDLTAIQAQTHASLSGMRAMLRYYGITGRADLLRAAQKRFSLYKKTAMTENGENYNWFGRPKWTEPCAVVDSYLVALWLWRFTADPAYLTDAQFIYYNGLAFEQRANGGFGLSNCAGAGTLELAVKCDEAYWCCTMRGAEGLARAAQFAFCTEGNIVDFTDFRNAQGTLKLQDGRLGFKEETEYPFGGTVRLHITSCSLTQAPELRFFTPPWALEPTLTLNGTSCQAKLAGHFATLREPLKKGDLIEYRFQLKQGAEPTGAAATLKGYARFFAGPLLLGYRGDAEAFLATSAKVTAGPGPTFSAGGITLMPVYHLMSPEVKTKPRYQLQVLFRPEPKPASR